MARMDWPLDFTGELARRLEIERRIASDPVMLAGAKAFYAASPVGFISDCVWVYEPRNSNKGMPTKIPVVPFPRQREYIEWLAERFATKTSEPVEKSRDSGATWMACAFAVWVYLFKPGSVVGFGSRKEVLVDQFGDMNSIFEKIRSIVRNLPHYLRPDGLNEKAHFNHMRLVNPENEASIIGEAGDNIGRGGRSSLFFVDEAAFIERPAMIEASLTANTDCRIDISSSRVGTLFNEWLATSKNKFIFDLSDAPWHTPEWVATKKADLEAKGLGHIFRQEYLRDATAGIEGQLIPSDWVEASIDACQRLGIKPTGTKVGALDVADGGRDRNALAIRHGVEVQDVRTRGDLLSGEAGSWAYGVAMERGCDRLLYDSIGVGAGAATSLKMAQAARETARVAQRDRVERILAHLVARTRRPRSVIVAPTIIDEGGQYRVAFVDRRVGSRKVLSPRGRHNITVAGWSAAGAVVNPKRRYEGNRTNEDMFANAKAQAWWALRDRFLATFKAVTTGVVTDADALISLNGSIAELRELKSELSQVTCKHSPAGKILINKAPDGHMSPNRADCVMISFAPVSSGPSIVGAF